MGKLRKKHNWKGRQQSDPRQPADDEKTDIVVELQGGNSYVKSYTVQIIWHIATCLFGFNL